MPLIITTLVTLTHYCYFRKRQVAIFGELDKIVPMSPQRVRSLSVSDLDIQVTLTGTPGEQIDFYFLEGTQNWWKFHCIISKESTATISVAQGTCY